MRLPLARQGSLGRLRVSVSRTSSWRGVLVASWFWSHGFAEHSGVGSSRSDCIIFLAMWYYILEAWGSSRYYWEGKRDSLCGGRCIFWAPPPPALSAFPPGEGTSTCVGI